MSILTVSPARSWYCFLFTLAITLYLVFIFRTSFTIGDRTYFTLVDDAMITMHYAKHYAAGQGVVWNVGDRPIQGFSNFGWMLYMALVHRFAISPAKISLVIMLTGLCILLVNTGVVIKIAACLSAGSWIAPFLSAWCVAFNFPLVFWSLRGMEVGIVSLFVNISALICLGQMNRFRRDRMVMAGVLFIVLFIMRTDSALQCFWMMAYIFIASLKQKRACFFFMVAGGVLLAGCIYLCLLQSYFGSWVPNTYYMKVTGVAFSDRFIVGFKLFMREAIKDISFPIMVIAGGAFFLSRHTINSRIVFLLGLFLVQCAYSLYVGGDYAENCVGGANRFITQGIGPLIIACAFVIDRLLNTFQKAGDTLHGRNRLLAFYAACIMCFFTGGQAWLSWVWLNAPMIEFDWRKARLGLLIREGTAGDAVVAVHAAGHMPYFSDRIAIDILGKNDSVVAHGKSSARFYPGHNKWDYAYSIKRCRPDVLADEWGEANSWMNAHAIKEYMRLPNGIWISRKSSKVNIPKLSKNYTKE